MTSYRSSLARNLGESERGLLGLQNIGNTCFLNSVIQCLSNTKPFLEYFLSQKFLKEINNAARCLLVKRFAEVIISLWGERISSLNIHSLKNAMVLYAPGFNGYNQQDAQECLKFLMEGLHTELNRAERHSNILSDKSQLNKSYKNNTPNPVEEWRRYLISENSIIIDTFGGLLKSILKCTFCGFISTVFEPFWDLSLPVPINNTQSEFQRLHLNHCLDWFTKEETLDGNEKPMCPNCKAKQTCTKRITIQRFPQILVIHLKRFSNNGMAHKVDTYIDFPIVGLNMSSYSADSQISTIYNLYGVVNHFGTCQFGHYTAFCKHPYSGNWHSFNDKLVAPIDPSKTDIAEAYILFYEVNL